MAGPSTNVMTERADPIYPEDVTLAIPCLNAAETLPQVLDAVSRLDPAPARVCCIDGGSIDATLDIIRDSNYVELIQQGPKGGLSAARNIALEHTMTPGLAMIDADIIPDPVWLGTLCERLTALNVAGVGASVVEQTDTSADRYRRHFCGLNRIAGSDDEHPTEWLLGANFLYRTEALRAVGGWDEKYELTYEDVAVGNRLRDAGFELYYTPATECRHLRTDTPVSVLKLEWRYFYFPERVPTSFASVWWRLLRYHAHGTFFRIRKSLVLQDWGMLLIALYRPFLYLKWDLQYWATQQQP